MKFDDFDKQMRIYEQSLDVCLLPDIYMVARLDGRSFTRLTREICHFEAPFDENFRDMMVGTVQHLMQCGFNVLYGFTESDEISLLFSPEEKAFGRKTRKYNSILAGEASAAFTHQLGRPAALDCRMVPLPNVNRVRDYFLWRQEDANRNALNAHCYWMLRKEGKTVQEATSMITGRSVAWKNELLFQHGINYDKVPAWQKRGIGLWWETYTKEGRNPFTGAIKEVERRKLRVEYELPIRDEYAEMVGKFVGV